MKRRKFITLFGSAIAWPLAAVAQQPDRMRLIGVLMGYAESDRAAQSWLAAFRGGLTKLGWTESGNLRIELRWSADNVDRMRALAKELVDLRPNALRCNHARDRRPWPRDEDNSDRVRGRI
jgi:putative ABC transport system substrate-binding protein